VSHVHAFIRQHFANAKATSDDRWQARCPAHDDRTASLSIARGDDGRVLLKCHAGCATSAIASAVGASMADLFPPRETRSVAAEYIYNDAKGRPVFRVVRLLPKDFRQHAADGQGGWLTTKGNATDVVYHLDHLQGRPHVVIAEGEKDVDALWALQLPATCNAGGAGKWKAQHSEQLRAAGVRAVYLLPDNDVPGRDHMHSVAASLQARGIAVHLCELPNLPAKGDVSDALASGMSRETLVSLLKQSPVYEPPSVDEKARQQPDTTATTAVPAEVPWPAPLGPAAFYGVLGELVRAVAPQTEAAVEGILVQLLAAVGNIVGRAAYFRVGATTHHLNLFATLVGRTGRGRKGDAWNVVKHTLREIDPDWSTRGTGGLSSGEGLIYAVRDPVYKTKPTKKGGVTTYDQVLEDGGVDDKRLLVIEPEFARALQCMSREGNTLSAVIRQAFDGDVLNTLTRKSDNRATDAHISIVAHITRDELRRSLQTTETGNGFANRFLWCCVKRARELPDGGRLPALSPFTDRLHAAVTFAATAGELHRDPAAQRLWFEVYGRLTSDHPGLLGAVTGRAEALVMRLACIFAICECSHVVTVPHLRAALEVWRYCYDSAAYIFGDTVGDATADLILRRLKAAYPEKLSKTELHDLFKRNRTATDLDRALQVLVDARLAATDRDASDKGRPVELVWYTPPSGASGSVRTEYEKDEINESTSAPQGVNSFTSSFSYAEEERAGGNDADELAE